MGVIVGAVLGAIVLVGVLGVCCRYKLKLYFNLNDTICLS